ncbi:MAG: anaerobic ribonucleoside-triphosphate reductase activating protein [Termitinemataceae bacterium]|nr:MAG: anaerobic ribonucleoside-triphosphate reductase activating protein [Termitinemataceae bacterium]
MNILEFNEKIYFRKTSLVDYPAKVSSVLFFSNCNMRCPWCQNGDLITHKNPEDALDLQEALSFIEKRQHILGGVVLSGGEPTLYPSLPKLISYIKSLNLSVKLDTNGTNPNMLKTLLDASSTRPDYIACDLKTNMMRYADLSVLQDSKIKLHLRESIQIISTSGIDHEFRSLVFPDSDTEDFLKKTDVEEFAKLIGQSKWKFRTFISGSCLIPEWNLKEEINPQKLADYIAFAKSLGANAS